MDKKSNKSVLIAVLNILSVLLIFVGSISLFSALWYTRVFGNTGFDSVLFTIKSDVDVAPGSIKDSFILESFLPAVVLSIIISFILLLYPQKGVFLRVFKKKFKLYPFNKSFRVLWALLLSFCFVLFSAAKAGAIDYIKLQHSRTTLYEDYYIDPDNVKIIFPKEKRNLIYIYLESMETTFFSTEQQGALRYNVIPELYKLASDNISFSCNSDIGGALSTRGATWTVGAMVAQSAGIPLLLPSSIDGNAYGQNSEFLPGVTTISDILNENGYNQALMVGSDSNFGGRKTLYERHGVKNIYDIYTARQDGIVPDDYYVWWGMEDSKLFDYAKQKITEMSAGDAPFAFTMLTVDTHHVGGYVCDKCEARYENQYENVLACSSRQVNAFVEWIKQQDFYDNTTVILCGDHPTMDNGYITANVAEDYIRQTYNCFINTLVKGEKYKDRTFLTTDIFPTTLAAIGCNIEGERLGLGTNLFSNVPTLCEELECETVTAELGKYSKYYFSNFFKQG